MTERRVGRLVAASLHQAIGDVLPQRIDFYEEWLDPDAMRDGHVTMAAMSAVLGFLRTEADAYGRVMERAGSLAAEWTLASLPAWRRRLLGGLPRPLRLRGGLRIAAQVARSLQPASRASLRVRRDRAWLDVSPSLFCAVRDPQPRPLCDFYAAVAIETLRQLGLTAEARLDQCRAMSGTTCRVALELSRPASAPATDPAIAA